MDPLISVITVTFNAAPVLEPTMLSVAQQTFRNFEHLIVDGASKDNTLDIARKFGTENLTIFSKKDTGIYHGMNRGLKLAKGKYVLFLNAGDRFASPETLQIYAEEAEKGADIIYGDTVIVDENGEILRKRHLSAPAKLTVESFKQGMLICHQAFMVRKELAPPYSKEYRFSADYDWTINCIKAGNPDRYINLNETVIHYLDNGATEKNKITSLKERYRIMSHHYGAVSTFFRHLSFLPRALHRKLK